MLLLIKAQRRIRLDLDSDPTLLPPRGAARVPDFKTLRWLDHHLWKEDPDPQNLASCLNTPIWDGIRAQDPDPALLPLRGAAWGPDPNPDGGPDPNSVLKTEKPIFSRLKEPRVAILGSEKPLRAREHTWLIFDA